MAKLYIKGITEPFDISAEAATKINAYYLDQKIPKDAKISVEGWSGEKGQIKGILNKGDLQKKNFIEEYQDEYVKNRRKRIDMSPSQRAENSKGYFDFIFYGFMNSSDVPPEAWEEAKELMTEFFENNPKRLWADPIIFKDMFPTGNITGRIFKILREVTFYDERMNGVPMVTEEESFQALVP